MGKPDASLSGVAGLVAFGTFLRAIGVDRKLRELFGDLKSRTLGKYPMEAQLRLLIDLYMAGEQRVFATEAMASEELASAVQAALEVAR